MLCANFEKYIKKTVFTIAHLFMKIIILSVWKVLVKGITLRVCKHKVWELPRHAHGYQFLFILVICTALFVPDLDVICTHLVSHFTNR
jgi:hypothetical protein